jgi:ElaB/YqjD/DUF883 family membrane-anchored ribosome-binding protein
MLSKEVPPMPAENEPPAPAVNPQQDIPPAMMRTELERQRQDTKRLLNDLAAAIAKSAGHVGRRAGSAAGHAAQYVQEHRVGEMVTGLGRFIRRHPASTLAGAVLAGFFVGRALRNR